MRGILCFDKALKEREGEREREVHRERENTCEKGEREIDEGENMEPRKSAPSLF